MKNSIFSALKFYYALIGSFISMSMFAIMPACDITDLITRQVSNQALTIWALLDLAEQENIVDQHLFYDELCQATLKLCKEVQQLKESGYTLADSQVDCFVELFSLLHIRFKALPTLVDPDLRYIHAIDIILHYADYFFKK